MEVVILIDSISIHSGRLSAVQLGLEGGVIKSADPL